jgi:hypothetical protein
LINASPIVSPKSCVSDGWLSNGDVPMPTDLDAVVEELIEDYNGDVSGIVGSLLVINEQLEIELNRLYKVINNGGAEQAEPRH